jgi:hypothetical protein
LALTLIGDAPLSVEKVLRGLGTLTLEDMAAQYNTTSALEFYYHSIPEQGEPIYLQMYDI